MIDINKIKVSNAQKAYANREWDVVASIYDELTQKNFSLPEKSKIQWIVSLKKQRKYIAAIELIPFFISMENSFTNDVWFFHLGECKQSIGEYRQAISYYEKALTSSQNKKNFFYRLSQCYEKLRDYDSALHYIQEASLLASNLVINAQLASVHYKQKNWSACALVFEDSIEKFGVTTFRSQWIYYYADSLWNMLNYTKASEYFKLLIKDENSKPKWLFRAYLAFFKNNELGLAEVTLTKAIELDNKNASFQLEMARLFALKGDIVQAKFFYEKSSILGNAIAQHELLSFDDSERIDMAPGHLFTFKRFDLVLKACYAKALISGVSENSAIDWRDLYIRHIYLRTKGKEPGNFLKRSLIDYDEVFSSLLRAIKEHGFDPLKSVPIAIDGGLLNGAHRISAAMALGLQKIPVVISKKGCGIEWDINWFIHHGFNNHEIHELIYNWVLNTSCKPYIAILWPTVHEHWTEITDYISSKVEIVFSKTMSFNSVGLQEFVKDVYSVEQPADFSDNISNKAEFLTRFGSNVKILLLDNQNDFCEKIKNDVREQYRHLSIQDPLSIIHVSDTTQELYHLNRMLFHYETCVFLQSRTIALTDNVATWIKELKLILPKLEVPYLEVCGVGGTVLNIYGIKKADDLDVTVTNKIRNAIFSDSATCIDKNIDVVAKNYFRTIGYSVPDDTLIFDRSMFVYVRGLKFANIDVVRKRKMFSLRNKDFKDLALIGEYYVKH